MSFYTGTIILSELLMLAISLHMLNYTGFTKQQKTWFLMTFFAIMLCAAAEYAVHCGSYSPAFKIPLTVLTVLQFSTAPVLAVLFVGALGVRRSRFAAGYFAVNLVIEAVSACFGWVFYFNEEGYFRGRFFIIYEVLYFFSLLYLFRGMIFVGKRLGHRDLWTIVMILVILAAGILPMTFFHLNITYFAIAISASLCYIYYEPSGFLFSSFSRFSFLFQSLLSTYSASNGPTTAEATIRIQYQGMGHFRPSRAGSTWEKSISEA